MSKLSLANLHQQAQDAYARQDYHTALELSRQMLEKKKSDPHGIILGAQIAMNTGRHDDAVAQMRKAIKANPRNYNFRIALGQMLISLGRYATAIAEFERALKMDGTLALAIGGKGQAFERQGKHDRARKILEPVLAKGERSPAIVSVYLRVLMQSGDLDEAVTLGRECLDAGFEPDATLRDAAFSLAKAYEKRGDYDDAFDAAVGANAIDAIAHDPETQRQRVDAMIETCTRELVSDLAVHGSPSEVPVFIVGMPRSGSTLVERILATHPKVYGAGEIGTMHRIATELSTRLCSPRRYPECLVDIEPENVAAFAQSYLDQIASFSRSAARITNKDLGNHQHVGLIASLFPNARVIHTRRDPVDTCLSCFMERLRPASAPYAGDLRHLGLYYRQYERLMNHWRETLDVPILDLDYEEMVRDQEGVTRRLLEFCGLEWDDACLRYHETKRIDRTLSYDQVRRPVYDSSVGRAERFGARLDPLREALATGEA